MPAIRAVAVERSKRTFPRMAPTTTGMTSCRSALGRCQPKAAGPFAYPKTENSSGIGGYIAKAVAETCRDMT
jgi:hypothetical protein